MKRKVLSILMVLLCVFASCSKDSDTSPDSNDIEEGKNNGKLAYIVSRTKKQNGSIDVKISLVNVREDIAGAWIVPQGSDYIPTNSLYYYDNVDWTHEINKADKTIIYKTYDLKDEKVYTVHIKIMDGKVYTEDITIKPL